MPLKVNVPVPALISVRAPPPFWITPLKTLVALSPPAVSVAAAPVVTVPVPASEPIAFENPPRFRIPVTV